jgi:hypothetical protein
MINYNSVKNFVVQRFLRPPYKSWAAAVRNQNLYQQETLNPFDFSFGLYLFEAYKVLRLKI